MLAQVGRKVFWGDQKRLGAPVVDREEGTCRRMDPVTESIYAVFVAMVQFPRMSV